MKPIPEYLLKGWPHACHVEGWNPGAQFRLVSIEEDGTKVLRTPNRGKIYRTKNRLLLTRNYEHLATQTL